jgi:hypothetical protein
MIPTKDGILTSISSVVEKGLAGSAFGGFLEFFKPKAIDIFDTRTATRISRDHQSIAVTNIGGGNTTNFGENENLYGFSLLKFRNSLLFGGWVDVNIGSLLGFDLTNSLTGGDEIANVSSYFFNINPRSISLSEPFATHIVPTQASGIYAESQGVVLRTLSISGTTGYRPGLPSSTSGGDHTIPHEIGEPTGFLNFIKLRNLFRNYSDLKKDAGQAYNTYLVWYNGKEQETWFCEPTDFSLSRDAGSPFTFNYSISLTLTQKVHFSSITNTINPRFDSPNFFISALRTAQILFERLPFIKTISTNLGLKNGVLNAYTKNVAELSEFMTDTTQGFMKMSSAATGAAGMLFLPLVGVITTAQKLIRAGKQVEDEFPAMFGEDANSDLTKFFSDNLFSAESILRNAIRDSQEALRVISEKMAAPTTNKLASNKTYYSSSSDFNAGGTYGDAPAATQNAIIPGNKTTNVPTLEDVLTLNGVPLAWKDWVIAYNNLKPPYITAVPSKKSKFIKGPGDSLILPMDPKPIPKDIYTKLPYKPNLNVYEELLGRDLKLNNKGGFNGTPKFNFSISPTGDLEVVDGKDNMLQALDIKLNVPRGSLFLHPNFGIVSVVGEKATRSLKYNLYLSINDTMLSDGRVEDLSDLTITLDGDRANIACHVNIIGSLPNVPVEFNMRV